jgi:beta-galactosidase/beta-glucuronidase
MEEQYEMMKNLYPRPDFLRSEWIDLTGEWKFNFDDLNTGEKQKWYISHEYSQKIIVPFVYQSELSGINTSDIHDVVWYEKNFNIEEKFKEKNIIVKFGAVDFYTKVWINGIFVGEHTGGYSSFDLNITKYINYDEDNIITLRVEDDSYLMEQPRGKQMWTDKTFGCWYKRYTGIWQPVWIDIVDEIHVESFNITPDIDNRKVGVKVYLNKYSSPISVGIKITFKDQCISNLKFITDKRPIDVDVNIEHNMFEWNGIALWDCENPNLYDIEFTVYNNERPVDVVKSYFGMRKVSVYKNKIHINNVPFYQKLLLNQGYYDKGHITPKNDEAIINDIKYIKDLGFNGIRIHEKIESPRFLYWCDKMGLLVWEEMPSAYVFSNRSIKLLINEWQDIIERDYNHPCIIIWVTFNESWGVSNLLSDKSQQAYVKAAYNLTKAMDQTRLVVGNDGWEHTETDICTYHDYVKKGEELVEAYKDIDKFVNGVPAKLYPRYTFADGHKYSGQPVIISEFGGISMANDSGWGYNDKVKDDNEFIDRIRSLVMAIKSLDYVCGYCFTQFTDVEQEQNGLMTMDRKFKIDPLLIKGIV